MDVTITKPRKITSENRWRAWEVRIAGELVGFIRASGGTSRYYLADRIGGVILREEKVNLGSSKSYDSRNLDHAKNLAIACANRGVFPTAAAIEKRKKEFARDRRQRAARQAADDRRERLERFGPRLYDCLKLMLNGSIMLSDAQVKSARDLLAEVDAPAELEEAAA